MDPLESNQPLMLVDIVEFILFSTMQINICSKIEFHVMVIRDYGVD